MKVVLPLLTVAGVVSGSFMERRQVGVVNAAFADITTKTEALDATILAYSQGGNAQPFIQASDSLLASIKSADSQVAASQPLTVEEATGIATGVLSLNSTVAKVIDDLIAKKSALVADKQDGTVYQSLQDQKTASIQFSTTVTGKTPDDIKPIASELSKGIVDSLNRGIAAFEGSGPPPGNSPPPGGAPTSSSSKSPPSSSAPGSSPTAPTSSGSLPTVSKPAVPIESPEPPCDSGPAPAPAVPAPTKPAVSPPYVPPSVPNTPALPAVPSKVVPAPAQYTAAAARVGASMFALGVAAVGLVM